MAITKVTVTSPDKLVGSVEASRVSSLSKRGDSNPVVLESISSYGTTIDATKLVGNDKATPTVMESAVMVAEIESDVEKLNDSGIGGTLGEGTELTSEAIFSASAQLVDTDSLMGGIGDNLMGIAAGGDVMAMSSSLDILDGGGLDISSFTDSIVPDLTGTMLSGFELPNIVTVLTEDLIDSCLNKFADNLFRVDDEWWWLDKAERIYDYRKLSGMSNWSLQSIERDDRTPEEVKRLSRALNQYRRGR